jgi:hypothetical protein
VSVEEISDEDEDEDDESEDMPLMVDPEDVEMVELRK